jgi:hypothetical protein
MWSYKSELFVSMIVQGVQVLCFNSSQLFSQRKVSTSIHKYCLSLNEADSKALLRLLNRIKNHILDILISTGCYYMFCCEKVNDLLLYNSCTGLPESMNEIDIEIFY